MGFTLPLFWGTLGSYLISLGLYRFMCKVGIMLLCTSLAEAPSHLKAFAHAVTTCFLSERN